MLYSNIYVGMSGVECEVNDFDFGNGVVLTKTYAHLMAPFLMAFTPPPNRGQPHPAPWAPATGGLGFDMTLQLSIPSDSQSSLPYDSTTIAWWLVGLMRLCVGPNLRAPAISSHPLSKESASSKELHIHPVEVEPCQLNIYPESRQKLFLRDLEWTKTHWATSLHLIDESPEFDLLFEAVDQAAFNRRPQLALLMLWAGIEEMFSPSKSELRYRISSLIAAYLEPPGRNRLNRQKNIAKLYDSRSTAAHGRADKSLEPLWDTYDLARQIVMKIINENHVPTKAELEERMFGAT